MSRTPPIYQSAGLRGVLPPEDGFHGVSFTLENDDSVVYLKLSATDINELQRVCQSFGSGEIPSVDESTGSD